MRKHLLGILLGQTLLLVCRYSAVAQPAAGLALKLINYTVQNNQGNVNLGFTITINAELTNSDTTAFAGTIDFGLRNSNTELSGVTGIFNKPPYTAQISGITLNPGETVPAIFSVDIDQPYFTPGPDVVVVWPISEKPVADSILIALNIADPTGIKEEVDLGFSYVIYKGKIQLLNTPIENPVQQVRIYNIYGQLLVTQSSLGNNEITVGNLPKGIYICEVKSAQGPARAFKFWQ